MDRLDPGNFPRSISFTTPDFKEGVAGYVLTSDGEITRCYRGGELVSVVDGTNRLIGGTAFVGSQLAAEGEAE